MTKPHATNPRIVHERRDRAQRLEREERLAEKRRKTPKVHKDALDPRETPDPLRPEETDLERIEWRIDPRVPRHDSHWRERPIPHRAALVIVLICLAVWIAAVLCLIAAPRSASDRTQHRVIVRDAGVRPVQRQSGAPQLASAASGLRRVEDSSEVWSDAQYPEPSRLPISGALRPRTERPVPVPSEERSGASSLYSAEATWCAPTLRYCRSWGGDAKLAAVYTFTWGDQPYWVRVWRGERHVDVLVVSHCGCGHTHHAIDLSPSAFEVLAPLWRGRIDVEVEDLSGVASEPLPWTDTE